MRSTLTILVLLFVAAVFLPSCQPTTTDNRKSVVVTYSVLGSIVRELVGEQARVAVSIPDGTDPHDWEPSARDIEAINHADLVVENGLGLETGMLRALDDARSAGVRFFTASDYIDIRYVGPGEGIPAGDPDQAIGAPDPHLWTDPLAMRAVAAALVDTLAKDLGLDVSAPAVNLEGRLGSLNEQMVNIVAQIPADHRKLVTGHESMGYFARRYGFALVGVIIPSLNSQAGVSAADLAALKTAIEENGVKAIFTELGTSPAVAQAISRETGVKVVELTTHALPPDGSYLTFMLNLANVIASALA